jgi:hypothetical protein
MSARGIICSQSREESEGKRPASVVHIVNGVRATEPACAASRRAFAPDALKAFAIFGVIYIHCRNLAGESPPIEILGEIFRISVPLFIIIWAYFQEPISPGGRPGRSFRRGSPPSSCRSLPGAFSTFC